MTKEELAKSLDGRQVGHELTSQEEEDAKQARLLIVFGASDDLIELRGIISDEVNAYDGGECYIKDGKLLPELDDETEIEALQKHGVLELVQQAHSTALKIDGRWDHAGYSWFMAAPVDAAPFDILEGDEKYCRGIVVQL